MNPQNAPAQAGFFLIYSIFLIVLSVWCIDTILQIAGGCLLGLAIYFAMRTRCMAKRSRRVREHVSELWLGWAVFALMGIVAWALALSVGGVS